VKHLTVIRHGEAEKQNPRETDNERRLSKGGAAASRRLGELLAEKGNTPGLVIISPAVRARQTAEAVCTAAGIGKERITGMPVLYENDAASIFEMLKGLPEGEDHVFLVGHNPSLTDLVTSLCGTVIPGMKTASAAGLDLNVNSWEAVAPGEASLVFYVTA